ncbi:uncharacterized protein LOC130698386 [Daphnia carinata]|uniref:uncharacterized protein LOC130698386 n=1 Tax=Daphnia carinata TaxID=120202 RepID=UPI00257D2490|nr:uncharacterized protein LOC130698386 [Daphnia carinata]
MAPSPKRQSERKSKSQSGNKVLTKPRLAPNRRGKVLPANNLLYLLPYIVHDAFLHTGSSSTEELESEEVSFVQSCSQGLRDPDESNTSKCWTNSTSGNFEFPTDDNDISEEDLSMDIVIEPSLDISTNISDAKTSATRKGKKDGDIRVMLYPETLIKYVGPGKRKGTSYYECLIGQCKIKPKALSAVNNSRGNIRKHISIKHNKEDLENFNILCKEIDSASVKGKRFCSLQQPQATAATSEQTQTKLSFSGYPRILTQEMFDNYIVEYLCDAVLPVYHTERPEFRLFLRRLCPRLQVKSRGYYRKVISISFEKKKMKLKEKLNQAKWLCTTADCWSSRRKSFLGMTIHWISEDFKRESYCLAIRRVQGKCDYDLLARLIESIHEEYDITSKVVATVTDNGSNFVKAFRLFSVKVPSINTVASVDVASDSDQGPAKSSPKAGCSFRQPYENASLVKILEEMESDFSESDVENEDIAEHLPSDASADFENVDEVHEDDAQFCFLPLTETLDIKDNAQDIYSLPTHRRCASHSLNLIASKDMLWKKQNRSTKASDVIQAKLKLLFVVHNETRWNSFFDAVERIRYFIHNKKQELKEVFEHFNIPYFRPAEEEYIKEFVKIMRPLADALDVLQADRNVSMGYLLPTLTILKNKLLELKRTPGIVHCKSYITEIIAAVTKRFNTCFQDDDHILAAILHPKFKMSWVIEENKSYFMDKLLAHHETFAVSASTISANRSPLLSDQSEENDLFSPKRKKDFFRSLTTTNVKNSYNEAVAFMGDPSTTISSLRKYPSIKEMYLKYNTALPSSASVERLFSVAGTIFRPTRNRLSDENFEKMLFLRANNSL